MLTSFKRTDGLASLASGPPGVAYWHSRGYLPHFESPHEIQHVTFQLADSLPVDALRRLGAELRRVSPAKREIEHPTRVDALVAKAEDWAWSSAHVPGSAIR